MIANFQVSLCWIKINYTINNNLYDVKYHFMYLQVIKHSSMFPDLQEIQQNQSPCAGWGTRGADTCKPINTNDHQTMFHVSNFTFKN